MVNCLLCLSGRTLFAIDLTCGSEEQTFNNNTKLAHGSLDLCHDMFYIHPVHKHPFTFRITDWFKQRVSNTEINTEKQCSREVQPPNTVQTLKSANEILVPVRPFK